jgi:eukaryotic-like serine/threonine-protein kinase
MLPFALRRTFAQRPTQSSTPAVSEPVLEGSAPAESALVEPAPVAEPGDTQRSEQEAARHGPLSNALDAAALAPRVPAGGRPTRPTLEPISVEDLVAALADDPPAPPAPPRATTPDLQATAVRPSAGAPREPTTEGMPALSTGALLHGGRHRLLQRFGAISAGAAEPPLFLASDAHDAGKRVLVQELPVQHMPPEEAERSMRVAAARLKEARQHALVPEVLDSFVERGRCFLILTVPSGSRLSDVIAREGPLAEPMAVQLGVRLLDALGRFASLTPPLVHGNLCPEHVFVHPNQLVELVGISPSLLTLRSQVAVGLLCGVGDYAAPEQRNGLTIEQSDQYAVGAILSNITAGQGAALPAARRGRKTNGPRPAKLSAALDAVLARARQEDPLDRYESADEMRRALQAMPASTLSLARGGGSHLTGTPATITAGLTPAAAALRATMEIPAITIARSKRSRVWPVIMVLALVTLLAAGIFIGWQVWAEGHHLVGPFLPQAPRSQTALGLNPTWTATTPPVR